jgi:hypothetical protein
MFYALIASASTVFPLEFLMDRCDTFCSRLEECYTFKGEPCNLYIFPTIGWGLWDLFALFVFAR